MSAIDIKDDEELVTLLLNAEKSDTDLLIDYITDNGKGRIALSKSVNTLLVSSKENNEIDEDTIRLLIRELQLFGGHSIVNLFRRNGVDYAEIVDDVMARLQLATAKSSSIQTKERLIIGKVFENAWGEMKEVDRKAIIDKLGIESTSEIDALPTIMARIDMGGIAAYQITKLVSGSLAASLGLGHAILGTLVGAIANALTGFYTLHGLSSPAFRVTLPCIVQIAWVRMKSSQQFCPQCNTVLAPFMKFCHQCGACLKE